MNGSNIHDETLLPKRKLSAANQTISGNCDLFGILPNPLGKTQKIPMQGLWQNILPEQLRRLSSTSTLLGYVRPGRCSQCRGCQ